jgi:hypothetical protein
MYDQTLPTVKGNQGRWDGGLVVEAADIVPEAVSQVAEVTTVIVPDENCGLLAPPVHIQAGLDLSRQAFLPGLEVLPVIAGRSYCRSQGLPGAG